MKKFTKVIAAVLALTFIVTAFAACSGGSKAKVKVIDFNLTTENYAFGVDKAQPELLTSVNEFIAEIKENGKFDEICNKYFGDGTPSPVTSATLDDSKDQLLVATNAAFAPFEYTEGDKFLGIDMEIAALLAEKLGKELVIQNMDFDSVCLSVGQHKSDIAMAGLTINEKREQYVTFSDAYYEASQKLIVPADNTEFDECKSAYEIMTILNAKDKAATKIGYQSGTTAEFFVKGDADWGFDGLPAQGVNYKNGSLAVQDLINGNLTYVIIDSAPASFITETINELA